MIIKMNFGSRVYGTAVPESDIDIKFIFQPDAKSILMENPSQHQQSEQDNDNRNKPEDIDIEGFSLKKYLFHLAAGQTFALDVLFTPEEYWLMKPDPIWLQIGANKNKIISKKVNAFVGYCRAQFTKYSLKGNRLAAVEAIVSLLQTIKEHDKLELYKQCFLDLAENHPDMISIGEHLNVCGRQVPIGATIKTAKDVYIKLLNNYGERSRKAMDKNSIDWKALYHAVRVAREAEELLSTGHITFPRPEAPLLLDIRKANIPFEQITELIEEGLIRVENALLKSTLPEEPDYNYINGLVFQSNLHEVRKIIGVK